MFPAHLLNLIFGRLFSRRRAGWRGCHRTAFDCTSSRADSSERQWPAGAPANGCQCSEKVAKATLIAVEIVRKNADQVGFAVNPRRWVVERFFAWIGRNRRLAKDFGYHRLRTRFPLRRIRHAARASDRSCFMTFETDSNGASPRNEKQRHSASADGPAAALHEVPRVSLRQHCAQLVNDCDNRKPNSSS